MYYCTGSHQNIKCFMREYQAPCTVKPTTGHYTNRSLLSYSINLNALSYSTQMYKVITV